jgi:hypothetical protein
MKTNLIFLPMAKIITVLAGTAPVALVPLVRDKFWKAFGTSMV